MVARERPVKSRSAGRKLATCTTAIARIPPQLWRLTLALRLDHADPNAGGGESAVVWVNPG